MAVSQQVMALAGYQAGTSSHIMNPPFAPQEMWEPTVSMAMVTQKLQWLRLADPPHPPKQEPQPRTRQAPPVTWGQLKSLSQKSKQKLLHTQTPITPETMLLAMVVLVSCAVTGADADLYWTYVPNPPLARPLTWNDPSSSVCTNNSHWFPDPNRALPNLTQKKPYIIILDDRDSPAVKKREMLQPGGAEVRTCPMTRGCSKLHPPDCPSKHA